MTLRLYRDEDSSDTDLLKALRLRGMNVVGAQESGMRGQSDVEQLKWATAEQRVLYRANRADFYRLHSEMMSKGEIHAGIILGHQQRFSIGEQMRCLLRIGAARTAEAMRNHVEFLSAWS